MLTFSNSTVTETSAGSGYTIDGTTLTITTAGTYRINGSCSEGAIIVSKGLSNVTLILDSLTLASSTTAPIVIKKSATVNIHLEGTSTLTDNEDPANETSTDATVAEAFEGAAIKVKSGSSVTFCGSGSLNIVANAKNGIKGGSTASLVFDQSGTINVSGSAKYYGATTSGAAVNNGIGCDGSIVVNQGTYVIKAANPTRRTQPRERPSTQIPQEPLPSTAAFLTSTLTETASRRTPRWRSTAAPSISGHGRATVFGTIRLPTLTAARD